MACPTADDLSSGIRIDYDDNHSIVTKDADGTVREVEYVDGTTYVYITDNSLLETGYEDTETGDVVQYLYTFDVAEHVPPKPWSGANGEQISLDTDGVEQERLPFYYRTRGTGELVLGECTYETIAFQTYYGPREDYSIVEFLYLIDLGIPLAIGYGGLGYFDPFPIRGISKVE